MKDNLSRAIDRFDKYLRSQGQRMSPYFKERLCDYCNEVKRYTVRLKQNGLVRCKECDPTKDNE